MPETDAPGAVTDQIQRIRSLVEGAQGREAATLLDDLRRRWASRPAEFNEESVAALRELAAAVTAGRLSSVDGVLRDTFGYPSFRPGQHEIIEAAVTGRDCIGIMPTGAGKSLTYQLAARVLGGDWRCGDGFSSGAGWGGSQY